VSKPLVSVIIVNWNTRALLPLCLETLRTAAGDIPYDVWLVDNASSDGSVEMVRTHYPDVHLIANATNVGFAAANNQAMAAAQGEYFLLLNSDAVLLPGALHALLAVGQAQPEAGIVGARLLNPDGSFQASHTRFPTLLREALILTTLGRRLYGPMYPSAGPDLTAGPQRVDYVEGACLFVRRSAWRVLGGLDEGYWMYAEEVDWCRRMAQAGWGVWYQPAAAVLHWGGASSANRRVAREADLYRSRVRFMRTYEGALQANALKLMLYAATAAKGVAFGLQRALGVGEPRETPSLPMLAAALHDV
jgi:GT2 family glycosyltransferase